MIRGGAVFLEYYVGVSSCLVVSGGAVATCGGAYRDILRECGVSRISFSVLVFLAGGPRCIATRSVDRVGNVGGGLMSIRIRGLMDTNLLRHKFISKSEQGISLSYARGTEPVVRSKLTIRDSFCRHVASNVARRS